jgi:hypothetical protein
MYTYIGLMVLARRKGRALSLVSEPSPSDVEIAIVRLKRYESPGTDQIVVELISSRR